MVVLSPFCAARRAALHVRREGVSACDVSTFIATITSPSPYEFYGTAYDTAYGWTMASRNLSMRARWRRGRHGDPHVTGMAVHDEELRRPRRCPAQCGQNHFNALARTAELSDAFEPSFVQGAPQCDPSCLVIDARCIPCWLLGGSDERQGLRSPPL